MQTPEEIAREIANRLLIEHDRVCEEDGLRFHYSASMGGRMEKAIAAVIAKERWLPDGLTPRALLSMWRTGGALTVNQLDTLRRWASEIEARQKGGE